MPDLDRLLHPDVSHLAAEAARPPEFAAIEARGAQRHRTRIAASTAAAAAVIVLAMLGASLMQGADRTASPAEVPPVVDRYAGMVAPFAEAPQVSGRWTLALGDDGKVVATPPAGYGSGNPLVAGRIGRGGVFGTDMFDQGNLICDSPGGTYRIVDRGDQLVFESVDDRCVSRVQFFTRTTWVSTSVTASTGPR